jgi:hypothetical protein
LQDKKDTKINDKIKSCFFIIKNLKINN